MLQDRYPREQLPQLLGPTDQWRPFPPAADRAGWDALLASPLNRRRAASVIELAEGLLERSWPPLPATLYMTYRRDGSRSPFEGPYFVRRRDLGALVLAECCEHKGRFVDQIINGMWAICEESTWCVPAHIAALSKVDTPDPLGRLDREIVDLFSAETAMVMAEAQYLLAGELDEQTAILRQRVRREIIRRVIDPVMQQGDFFWLSAPMNWNPWCSSNVLGAGYYVLDDPQQVADLTWRLMGSTDAFLAGQLPDGGCNEGPNYWGVAPGAMVQLLELLHGRSAGKIDIYDEPLVRNLGLYLPRVHLDGPWFATFADCPPLVGVRRAATYRYGERIGDASMRDLVLLEMRGWDAAADVEAALKPTGVGCSLTHWLREMAWLADDQAPSGAALPLHTWLPDLQVMVARQSAEAGAGLVVAAKGGHNEEWHNHNDVGQFILVADGTPMIADVGVESYTAKTFGPRRYEIWCIRGSGHNVPVVDGVEQAFGSQHAAADVACESDGAASRVVMDLAGAYPADAGLASLTRAVAMDRDEGTVTVTDAWKLDRDGAQLALNLFTPAEVDLARPGAAVLTHEGVAVELAYDPAVVSLAVTPWPIDDKRLQSGWGERLNRLTATVAAGAAGQYSLTFRRVGVS